MSSVLSVVPIKNTQDTRIFIFTFSYLRLINSDHFLKSPRALVWFTLCEAEEQNQRQESHSSKHLWHNHVLMWIRKHECSGCPFPNPETKQLQAEGRKNCIKKRRQLQTLKCSGDEHTERTGKKAWRIRPTVSGRLGSGKVWGLQSLAGTERSVSEWRARCPTRTRGSQRRLTEAPVTSLEALAPSSCCVTFPPAACDRCGQLCVTPPRPLSHILSRVTCEHVTGGKKNIRRG